MSVSKIVFHERESSPGRLVLSCETRELSDTLSLETIGILTLEPKGQGLAFVPTGPWACYGDALARAVVHKIESGIDSGRDEDLGRLDPWIRLIAHRARREWDLLNLTSE